MMRAITFPDSHLRTSHVRTRSVRRPLTTAPFPHPTPQMRSARVTALTQAMSGAAAVAPHRGSILIPLSLSFVSGTLGAALGGFWWSMAAGAAGYITGELLR